jgi:hypothetical protein
MALLKMAMLPSLHGRSPLEQRASHERTEVLCKKSSWVPRVVLFATAVQIFPSLAGVFGQ